MCCWESLLCLGPSFQILYKPTPSLVRNYRKVSALSPEANNMVGSNLRVGRLSVKAKYTSGIIKIRIRRGE